MLSDSRRVPAIIAASTGAVLVLSSCAGGASSPDPSDETLSVAAAFYPLQYVAEQVAGDHATVVALAPPGVEAHDIELSPATVRELQSADTVLYLAGFQPAVDDAVASTGVRALDVTDTVALRPAVDDDHADEEDEHADEEVAGDPHFWLDPVLLAEYAQAVAAELGAIDPTNAEAYDANADALEETLSGIDQAYATGLESCERDTIFVAHEAFGYLTERYGFHEEGFAGLDPEAEPSPARLLEIKELVEQTGATVIFTEDEVSARVAEALAADAGVATAVLSPIETVTGDDDYAAVMTRNLEQIRSALGCA